MSFKDLDLKLVYTTTTADIAKTLIVPLLSQAVSYKRAVGFFSSSSLLEISKGLGLLAKNSGKVQLIASPNLSEEDVQAIESGYQRREAVVRDALLRELPEPSTLNLEERNRYNLLANLIASNVIDIKIAFVDKPGSIGIFHDKLAVVEDPDGNIVSFSGSMNETRTALRENYESVDVFRSWSDPEGRVPLKVETFESIWNNRHKGLKVHEFQEVKEIIKKRYLIGEPDYSLDTLAANSSKKKSDGINEGVKTYLSGYPKIPDFIASCDNPANRREYQWEAVERWVGNGYRGLFDMATGTGKTITALIALTRCFFDSQKNLVVFITCPYQHLVDQWVEDLNLFGIKPIVAYAGTGWKRELKDALLDRRLKIERSNFICCITTNATFATRDMQNEVSKIRGDALLIADEAHNMGAPSYQKTLSEVFNYRVGLSATINRHHDEEGTEVLRDYFGPTCIEYSLDQAIRDGMLCKYKYHPVVCTLSVNELAEYDRLSAELGKYMVRESDSSGKQFSSAAQRIAQARARVVAGAVSKLDLLRNIIQPYKNQSHILVYCGATQVLEAFSDSTDVDTSDKRQIKLVDSLLGNELGMTISNFTSEESIEERAALKKEFETGNFQALVAIKCLDEGVNIPNIRTAFMLASTTNPKEYIQRRGRLLRQAPGKEYAEIFDFITLPYCVEDASGQTIEELRKYRRLITNELERGFEFARSATEPLEALEMLGRINDVFRVSELAMLDHE